MRYIVCIGGAMHSVGRSSIIDFSLRPLVGSVLFACLAVQGAFAAEADDYFQRQTLLRPNTTDAVIGAVRALPTGGMALGKGAPEFMHTRFGQCRWLDARNATDSIFIPDRDAAGWNSVAAASQINGVIIDNCTCPATGSTVTASDGQSAPVTIASSYATGDGRPNASSAFYQGRASATFGVADGCATQFETVTNVYNCSSSGWQLASSFTSPWGRDESGCVPEPEPAPPPPPAFSRVEPPPAPIYDPPVSKEAYREEPVFVWSPPAPPPPEPVVVAAAPPPPPPPPPEPVIIAPPPPSPPAPSVDGWEECTRWGQNDFDFDRRRYSSTRGSFYGDCQ